MFAGKSIRMGLVLVLVFLLAAERTTHTPVILAKQATLWRLSSAWCLIIASHMGSAPRKD